MNKSLSAFSWLVIPLIFILFAAPGAVSYVFFHPDEKYYTDASLQMIGKNDFLTPCKADGSPRFNKPIITYWALIASYKLMGVSPFSSRMLFLLSGALLVVITFFMARSLMKDQNLAWLAAFITAANPLLIISSSRSIPDILLTLFLTISAWGFMEILVAERPLKKFFWMAWMGAALAFETKGIPAVAYTGISVLYLLVNPWKRRSPGSLIHFSAMMTAFVVAVSWFVLLFRANGPSWLGVFFADQLGARVSSRAGVALGNTFQAIVFFIAYTLPWFVISFSRPGNLQDHFKKIEGKTKALYGFCLVWVVFTIVMSGAVFKFYDRYLLPVMPVCSLFFASVIIKCGTRFKKFFLKLFVGLSLVVSVVNILYALTVSTDYILVVCTIVMLFVLIACLLELFDPIPVGTAIAAAFLLLYFNVFILLRSVLMPGVGEQLAESLKQEQISEADTVYVYGNIRTASALRIQSHNHFHIVSMDTVFTVPKESNRHFLVFRSDDQSLLDLRDYEIFEGSQPLSRVPVEELPSFLQPQANKEKGKGHYLIARRKTYSGN